MRRIYSARTDTDLLQIAMLLGGRAPAFAAAAERRLIDGLARSVTSLVIRYDDGTYDVRAVGHGGVGRRIARIVPARRRRLGKPVRIVCRSR